MKISQPELCRTVVAKEETVVVVWGRLRLRGSNKVIEMPRGEICIGKALF